MANKVGPQSMLRDSLLFVSTRAIKINPLYYKLLRCISLFLTKPVPGIYHRQRPFPRLCGACFQGVPRSNGRRGGAHQMMRRRERRASLLLLAEPRLLARIKPSTSERPAGSASSRIGMATRAPALGPSTQRPPRCYLQIKASEKDTSMQSLLKRQLFTIGFYSSKSRAKINGTELATKNEPAASKMEKDLLKEVSAQTQIPLCSLWGWCTALRLRATDTAVGSKRHSVAER